MYDLYLGCVNPIPCVKSEVIVLMNILVNNCRINRFVDKAISNLTLITL